jgi:nucleoid DNA-binding protein
VFTIKTKRIHRADIAEKIHKRLKGIVTYIDVYYSINIIIESILEDLINNQTVSVGGFGTLNPYIRKGHLAHNVYTKKIRKLPEIRMIKFIPQNSLLSLLKDKYENFRKKKS